MNWLEIALLVFGACAFAGSFLVKGKSDDGGGQEVDVDLIRSVIDKEMRDAKERVTEVVDETLEYAVEKTERASERISNEKIMAISEYSETVLADINKSHQEVVFLYDMLNDKHNNLKETIKHVDKTAKEAEEAANAAALALAAKAKEDAEAREKEMARKNNTDCTLLDKEAQEKEYARRQMARLILPMQQEMQIHRQVDARALDIGALGLDIGKKTLPDKPIELSPLIVKSVEIIPADIVMSKDMQPVPENTGIVPVSAAELQTFGSRPEDMKVVDVKPAEIRPVEVYSFVDQAPHIERPVKKEVAGMIKPQDAFSGVVENNNDRILRLYKEGYSNVDIAKELGLGVGEVKLVINLFKGAV